MGWIGGKGGNGAWGARQPAFQKGWGKGKRQGNGKGGGDLAKKAWIGGLQAGEASVEWNKDLMEHMKQARHCKYVRIGKCGSCAAIFDIPEEVQTAIATLNGRPSRAVWSRWTCGQRLRHE
jgi:hypothetical protein